MKPGFPCSRRPLPRTLLTACVLGVVGLSIAGCAEPEPRSFALFMEDRIAREGTLTRCDSGGADTRNDIECANARRAEATIALGLERERLQALEVESERRIEELNRRIDERERLAREAALQAVLAEREAYEELWRERMGTSSIDSASPEVSTVDASSFEATPAPARETLSDDAAKPTAADEMPVESRLEAPPESFIESPVSAPTSSVSADDSPEDLRARID